VRRFYVLNYEEFSFCRKRQYSYNERNTLKLRGNCEWNFDGVFSSYLEITFFCVCPKLFRAAFMAISTQKKATKKRKGYGSV